MKARTIAATAIVTVVTAVAAGCATAPNTGSGTSGPIPHPGEADRVVLRLDVEGGFVSPAVRRQQSPPFSLFGDGTVITTGPQSEIYPQAALPPLLTQHVSEAGMQAILAAALDAGLGGRHDDLRDLGTIGITDAATTVFTLEADGLTTTLRVYALGQLDARPNGMGAQEFALRGTLQRLATELGQFERWLPTGSITSPRPFEGAGARVFVSDYRADPQLSEPEIAWPLSTPLTSFGEPSPSEVRCGIVAVEEWTSTLLPLVRTANQLTPWTSEGDRHALAFRPLLPDEHGC